MWSHPNIFVKWIILGFCLEFGFLGGKREKNGENVFPAWIKETDREKKKMKIGLKILLKKLYAIFPIKTGGKLESFGIFFCWLSLFSFFLFSFPLTKFSSCFPHYFLSLANSYSKHKLNSGIYKKHEHMELFEMYVKVIVTNRHITTRTSKCSASLLREVQKIIYQGPGS